MPKLLVVDDEPIIRHSFQKAFASAEVEVLTAGTLAEGRKRVEADRPDVVVVDLQLPDGSGLDLLRWVIETDSFAKSFGEAGGRDVPCPAIHPGW